MGLCHGSLYRSRPDRSRLREEGLAHSCWGVCWGHLSRWKELGPLVSGDSLQAVAIGSILSLFAIVRIKILSFYFTSASSVPNSLNGAPGLLSILRWPRDLPIPWYILIDLSVHHFWKFTWSRMADWMIYKRHSNWLLIRYYPPPGKTSKP